ncbi:flagellar motor switch protein FliG [Desertivibrio insolitus]|uniref:flagellar motor switch protein FliG n=1 Tax=Herbiconiux sp. SYSU D00978 TaxID=2812562 RepID=UPI001A9785E0|nr:FliG C-terminal domain-containing protein [Herbiconiux sp. SYSU D00978]
MSPQRDLTGVQKAAIVLMQLEQERAAAVLQRLDELEAEEIAAEVVRLRRVDSDLAATALEEFQRLTVEGPSQTRGGHEVATALLEATFGTEKAAGVMEKVATSVAGASFEFLADVEPPKLVLLLDGELPATIALVLAQLPATTGSVVISGLKPSDRVGVARAMATMGTPTPEAASIVADVLKDRLRATVAAAPNDEQIGGIAPLVEIINRSDVALEKSLLEDIEALDPTLAAAIRAQLLSFDDILFLAPRDVQKVLRGIEPAGLAAAMSGADERIVELITANISGRNRELLAEEIELLGTPKQSAVEEARAVIVRSMRELHAEGSIEVDRDGGGSDVD